jgi:Fe-S-cluster containining protein
VANLKFENVVFPDAVGFVCRNCGFCCKNNPPDINFKEQQKIEAQGHQNFLENPKDPCNRNVARNKRGACVFLTKENTCKIHDVKPSICSLEPFIISDYDDKTNMIFLQLNPNAAQTCRGAFKGEVEEPKKFAVAAQTIIKEISQIAAEKLGLSVGDKKVSKLTMEIVQGLNEDQTR